MSEEVKVKMSIPMFEVGELERFDNNIHNIIEEYSKMILKEKDQILTQRIIIKQEQEIKDLQQKIDKAKKYIYRHWITYNEATKFTTFNEEMEVCIKEIKELLEILGDKENE